MRSVAVVPLALLALLASCASTGADASWRDRQRERIDRLYRARDPGAALAAVLRAAPAPRSDRATRQLARAASRPPAGSGAIGQEPIDGRPAEAGQDPQHLDQRLPPAPGVGPRPFRHTWQPLEARLDVGVGTVDARVSGTALDDRTDATFVRARVDAGTGAALHAEFWSSDDQLFEGRFISDGVTPKSAAASLGGVDVFPHVRIDNQWGDLRVPVRIGAFTDWQRLEGRDADVLREWTSFGPRLVVEPTWRFLSGEHGNLELFTTIGGEVGPAWFKETFRNGDDRDVSARWGGELGGGLRGTLGALQAEVGYRLNHTTFGRIDSELYGNRSRTDLQRQQLFISFGLTY